jgi:antitoxin CptB
MREMDLLLGQFADARIAELDDIELDDFERLMDLPDYDVFMWLCDAVATPPDHDTPIMRELKHFHRHERPIDL